MTLGQMCVYVCCIISKIYDKYSMSDIKLLCIYGI